MMAYNSYFHGLYLGTYYETQRSVRNWLIHNKNINPELRIKLFSHLGEGLFESFLSLGQTFAHKKKIAIIGGHSPLTKIPQSWFLINKYEVKNYNWIDVSSQKEEILSFDPSILVIPRDHILTGEKLNLDWLDLFKNKRIGLVTWSHFREADFSWICDWPYGVYLNQLGNDYVVGAFGPRVEFNHLISSHGPQKNWAAWQSQLEGIDFNSKKIVEFEKELTWGLTPFRFLNNSELSFQKVAFTKPNFEKNEFDTVIKNSNEKYHYEQLSLCQLGVAEEELSWMNPKLSGAVWKGLIIRSVK